MALILASGSPRRRELLKLAGLDFTVKVPDCDETLPDGVSPQEAVLYLSRLKGTAAARLCADSDDIIAADTVVAFDDVILGKPADREDAKRMLRMLSGRTHQVYTGVYIRKSGREKNFAVKSDVTFYPLSGEEIDAYVATGECDDKAGAYGIQERGGLLVERINGDWFNIVGLPAARVVRELND